MLSVNSLGKGRRKMNHLKRYFLHRYSIHIIDSCWIHDSPTEEFIAPNIVDVVKSEEYIPHA